jgi:hypothetical protein
MIITNISVVLNVFLEFLYHISSFNPPHEVGTLVICIAQLGNRGLATLCTWPKATELVNGGGLNPCSLALDASLFTAELLCPQSRTLGVFSML